MLNKQKFLSGLGLAKRAGKCVTGDGLMPGIQSGKVPFVVVADDMSQRSRKQYVDKCQTAGAVLVEGLSIVEISQAIGMNNRVAVGIQDAGFIKLLKTNL